MHHLGAPCMHTKRSALQVHCVQARSQKAQKAAGMEGSRRPRWLPRRSCLTNRATRAAQTMPPRSPTPWRSRSAQRDAACDAVATATQHLNNGRAAHRGTHHSFALPASGAAQLHRDDPSAKEQVLFTQFDKGALGDPLPLPQRQAVLRVQRLPKVRGADAHLSGRSSGRHPAPGSAARLQVPPVGVLVACAVPGNTRRRTWASTRKSAPHWAITRCSRWSSASPRCVPVQAALVTFSSRNTTALMHGTG